MQITLNLPDDLGQELKNLPSPELFVAKLVKAALQQRKAQNQSSPLVTPLLRCHVSVSAPRHQSYDSK